MLRSEGLTKARSVLRRRLKGAVLRSGGLKGRSVLPCFYPTSSAMVKSSSACRRTDFTRSSFAVAIRIRRRGAW